MGFVTRGRGVSVHRIDCANAHSLSDGQINRVIDVDWDREPVGVFAAAIEVKALDRERLLMDVSSVLADSHVSIVSCTTHVGSDRVCKMKFEFEMGDPSHLESILGRIKTIDSVYDSYRVIPGKGA